MKKIQIIGSVTRDAEVQTIATDRSAINFAVAVNERWKDKSGQKMERVTFIKCTLWCKNPSMSQYIKKGLKVWVSGSPEAEAYTGSEGKAVANLKIIVRDIEFLNNPSKSSGASLEGTSTNSTVPDDSFVPVPDNDLPF